MPVIHIGLPKTGTTFIQRNIFARAPGVLFVHRSQGRASDAFCMRLRHYVRANCVTAIWLRFRLRLALRQFLADARRSGRTLLVSAENISVHSVLFWHGRDPGPEQVARRLAELMHGVEPARIVIGLRDQAPWLASRYAESAKDCSGFDQEDFDRRLRAIAGAPELTGSLAWLDHNEVHARFAGAFGAENLHAIFLERLDAKPGWILEQLGLFVAGAASGREFRALGRLSAGDRRNVSARGDDVWKLKTSPKRRLVLSPELRAAIESRFAASNKALRERLAHRLPPFGQDADAADPERC